MNVLNHPRSSFGIIFFSLSLQVLLTSCTPTELTPKNTRSDISMNDGSLDGKAFVYEDSPYILAGENYGLKNIKMSSLVTDTPQLITNNEDLTGNCVMLFQENEVNIPKCIKSLSKESETSPLTRQSDQTFIFAPDSPEFYQVNTLYHINKTISAFL